MIIRAENSDDFIDIERLIISSFANMSHSNHREQDLVKNIRMSNNYIPRLSLVAVENGEIIGYIMLSKITLIENKNELVALALAPICVANQYQNKGVGSKLIGQAEQLARQNFNLIILLGEPKYYNRFDYKPTVDFNIKNPFDVPNEFFMAKYLGSEQKLTAKYRVVYPSYFY